MTIKPFENAGRFTTFENDIIDYIMPICKPNTWKIICATIRKTTGWHKDEDWITVSQFMVLTGIKGRGTCHNAIEDAIDNKFLTRKKFGTSFKYALNREYEISNVPKIGTLNVTEIGTSNVPKTGHTKETITKDNSTKEKKEKALQPAPNGSTTKETLHEMVLALDKVTGIDHKLQYGRLAKDGKKLLQAGYTAEDVGKIYFRGGDWFTEDAKGVNWKGYKNKERPATSDILNTIKELSGKNEEKRCPDCQWLYDPGDGEVCYIRDCGLHGLDMTKKEGIDKWEEILSAYT